ncbi:hypothetical protein [Jidongwangia harbinensis]|uniref:hypothetical protein n=1 Tax=Jidongwangia harbinensis TaxID=2878561 RepID=UPI001CD97D51|nr:hypothetical protein [Jidongwangia harbinensis]MCA2214176.1 hypothetical protein [Jidongwangia harbinensis]
MSERPDDDLAGELRALGARLDVPEPVDQRSAVRARLARPVRRRHRTRWWTASAVAAILGTVAAVAPARAAVVDAVEGLLRVTGIEVRRGPVPDDLPSGPSPLPSLRSTGLVEARRIALFPVLVPAALGAPDQVLPADPDRNGAPRVVTLTYRGGAVRLDQFDGAPAPAYFKSAPAAHWTTVRDGPAIWLPGPHPVTYVDRDRVERTETARLAAPTLVWSAGGVTYRLEGLPTLAEAQEVAVSLR